MAIALIGPSPAGASIIRRVARLGVSTALIALSVGCRADGFEPPAGQIPPASVEPVTTVYGSVLVRMMTSGENLDPDGFVVQFDGAWDYEHEPTPVATNGTVTLSRLSPGNHSLTILGVAANCVGESLADRPIVVKANTVIEVSFTVVCSR